MVGDGHNRSRTNGASDRLIYDSPSDTYGIDTLTYTIADEWGRTATATVTLWISPRAVPQFATLNLLNDTGHYGDLVTTDATVAGTVTIPHEVEGLLVEVDYTGDHVADAQVDVTNYVLAALVPEEIFWG